MNITQLFNSNSFPRANNPKFIILHGTAGETSAQAIAQYFKNTEGSNNPVSAHYVIGVQGEIYQCNDEHDGAWADGAIDGIPTAGLPFRTQSDGVHRDDWWDPNGTNPNDEGIAIEHCKPSIDNSDVLTPAQQASSLWLVNDIATRWNIPKHFADASGGITGHFSVSAVNRQHCPGVYPWDDLWTYLKGVQQPMTPSANQLKAATDMWYGLRKDCPIGTGIYTAWLADYLVGKFHGPPTSLEQPSVDWTGNPIIVQYFAFGWVQWYQGAATWYGPTGKV